ncbi:hypothetical protein [Frateuria sp. STR12]|uniref:hypothetical protein n=1 Tax=Frateuria hangzhouensis TaxID=2995589 RepID=UPI0022609D65|nr:hypothetical protein [Frateuria sp. STR12]MCX7515324.1 hypothetical protein [Frateuria sp. STR12]
MNHDPRFPSPDDEAREWHAQERAFAEERAGLASAQSDPRLRSYRLMAHVLAQSPPEQLPPDFARQMARRVQRAKPIDTRLERRLLALLVTTMAVAGLAAIVVYGARWLPALDLHLVGAVLATPWAWALAACLGLSRLSRHWLHHDQPA